MEELNVPGCGSTVPWTAATVADEDVDINHRPSGLPDEDIQLKRSEIHTREMRENGKMAPTVDQRELSVSIRNFSGAEKGGLVKTASSNTMNEFIKVSPEAKKKILVTRNDFIYALKNDVKPVFGGSREKCEKYYTPGSPVSRETLVGLPNKDIRLKRLEIDTANMRENGFVAPDVDLKELSVLTKNFSEDEISVLVTAAVSIAMVKFIMSSKTKVYPEANEKILAKKNDITYPIENYFKSVFGGSREKCEKYYTPGSPVSRETLGLPDEDGRLKKLEIDKAKMRENGQMALDVDLK